MTFNMDMNKIRERMFGIIENGSFTNMLAGFIAHCNDAQLMMLFAHIDAIARLVETREYDTEEEDA